MQAEAPLNRLIDSIVQAGTSNSIDHLNELLNDDEILKILAGPVETSWLSRCILSTTDEIFAMKLFDTLQAKTATELPISDEDLETAHFHGFSMACSLWGSMKHDRVRLAHDTLELITSVQPPLWQDSTAAGAVAASSEGQKDFEEKKHRPKQTT